MKIKQSEVEKIIKEELKIFFENDGKFPGTSAPEEENFQNMNEMMKSDLKLMYERLLQNLGAEKLLYEIVNKINPKALREVIEMLGKLYDIRF